VPATIVAPLYKNRRQIELLFHWIKQHLRIKHFFGTSPNAVSIYALIATLHMQHKLPGSLHRTLQILSVYPFGKISVNELLTATPHNFMDTHDYFYFRLW
jgi:hypothetical protein